MSNPTGLALLRTAKPDEALIDKVVPSIETIELVLVGHAHYDHAMKLPVIARAKARNAMGAWDLRPRPDDPLYAPQVNGRP